MKALITGASSGIGREMARYLEKMGWDLIICARRSEKLDELRNELSNVNVECIPADLSDRSQCAGLYEKTKNSGVDFFICNAGFGLCGEFKDTPLDREVKMIDTNVTAMHILIKLYLNDFTARNSGHILVTASSAGFLPGPGMTTYYATKNYIVRLCEGIYEELRRSGSKVKISLLCPGPVNTEFDQVADVQFAMKGLSAQYTAKYAIEKSLKGKLLIIPGSLMKLGVWIRHFASEKLLCRIVFLFQRRKIK